MTKNLKIAPTACLLFGSLFANAIVPNSLFTDNMVLQRGVIVPVWGAAKYGETITIAFGGQ